MTTYHVGKIILAEVIFKEFNLSSKHPRTNFPLKIEKDLSFIIIEG